MTHYRGIKLNHQAFFVAGAVKIIKHVLELVEVDGAILIHAADENKAHDQFVRGVVITAHQVVGEISYRFRQ